MSGYDAKLSLISKFRDCDELSDFVIVCGQRKWQVHRFVLAIHSNVLKKACSNGFSEAHKGTLDLSEYEQDLVHALIDWMYDLDYDAATYTSAYAHTPAFHVQLLIIADKYNIHYLQEMAVEKFKIAAQDCSSEDFANAATLAYNFSVVTREIRRVIVKVAVENEKIGVNANANTELEQVMIEQPALAVEIAKAFKAQSQGGQGSPPEPTRMDHAGSSPQRATANPMANFGALGNFGGGAMKLAPGLPRGSGRCRGGRARGS